MIGGKEIKRRIRRTARHSALTALSWNANRQGRIKQALETPRVHFAYLHDVPVHEEPQFRRLLATLATQHEIVSHSEAIRRIRSGAIKTPTISFSFDDAFASNYRAAGILEEYGAVGMFFVPTQFPETPTLEAARAFFGYSQNVPEPAMSWRQIDNLLARGHEIGNHTLTHRDLAALPPEQAIEQIEKAAQELSQRLGGCPHFAWPFGRRHHITPEAVRAAFASGHDTCVSAERGSHSATVAEGPLVLLRDHLMTAWPHEHNLYFLAKSAERPVPPWSSYPEEWK